MFRKSAKIFTCGAPSAKNAAEQMLTTIFYFLWGKVSSVSGLAETRFTQSFFGDDPIANFSQGLQQKIRQIADKFNAIRAIDG